MAFIGVVGGVGVGWGGFKDVGGCEVACMLLCTFHENHGYHHAWCVCVSVCVTLGGYDWGRCVAFTG